MSGLDIVSRSTWRARRPKKRYMIATPTPRLWVHHLASEWHGASGVRKTQDYHMDINGWSDIGYNFLVDDDGTIYEGRGAGVAGGHTEGDNTFSHAICAMGDLDARPPTEEQVASIAHLAAHGRADGWWGEITGGHRDARKAQTACPGRHLYAAIPDIRARALRHATLTTDTTSEDEMTPEQDERLGRIHHELVADQDNLRAMVAQANWNVAVLMQKVDELLARP